VELWTAFLLGLVGSLHCAGMCGPIALIVPAGNGSTAGLFASRAAYNFGRITTYCILGAIFGLLGKSFELVGFQRWVSLVAGVLILIALFVSSRFRLTVQISKSIALVKNVLGQLLKRRGTGSIYLLGAVNGFLPCGLVYAACAAAAAGASAVAGVEYMLSFGLGTVPMMLAVGMAGKKIQLVLRFRFERLIPLCLVFVAVLLIVRGLALGIPYLSPDATGSCCAR
jgi:sulfite exporter TauE/SafE